MLFGRRKRLKELEEAEAEGRSFWTAKLDQEARYKIAYAVDRLSKDMTGGYSSFDLIGFARSQTLTDLGLPHLLNQNMANRDDAMNAILNAQEDIVFSFLEALLQTAVLGGDRPYAGINYEESGWLKQRWPLFVDTIKTVLREHRVSFDLVGSQFVPFESREMHEAVVVPTLTLLGGTKAFAGVEKAYRAALDEIHTGDPADAITDAGTALQIALSALGCDGNALGPLATSAQKNGLIIAHDKKLIDWVSADRSIMGDAHNVQPASTQDAWLAVHVVGAIILRITGGPPRAT